MPGTNLTRDEAQTRARLLDVDSSLVELDLTSETLFASTRTMWHSGHSAEAASRSSDSSTSQPPVGSVGGY